MKKILRTLFKNGKYVINKQIGRTFIIYLIIRKTEIRIVESHATKIFNPTHKFSYLSKKQKRKLVAEMIDTYLHEL